MAKNINELRFSFRNGDITAPENYQESGALVYYSGLIKAIKEAAEEGRLLDFLGLKDEPKV